MYLISHISQAFVALSFVTKKNLHILPVPQFSIYTTVFSGSTRYMLSIRKQFSGNIDVSVLFRCYAFKIIVLNQPGLSIQKLQVSSIMEWR